MWESTSQVLMGGEAMKLLPLEMPSNIANCIIILYIYCNADIGGRIYVRFPRIAAWKI